MGKVKLLMALVALIGLVGCGREEPQHRTKALMSQQELIESFKERVKKNIEKWWYEPKVFRHRDGFRRIRYLARLKGFDIRKTDSIVSPYKGIAEMYIIHELTSPAATIESAMADNQFEAPGLGGRRHIHTYLLVEGTWRISSGENYWVLGWHSCKVDDGMWCPQFRKFDPSLQNSNGSDDEK